MRVFVEPGKVRIIKEDGEQMVAVGMVIDVEITLPNGRKAVLDFPKIAGSGDSGEEYDLPFTD